MTKRALITGIAGQDGSYLSEYLLSLGYEVHGMIRRHSVAENQNHRLHRLNLNDNIHTYYGDLLDYPSLIRIVNEVQPDEIYNLGAQSHVGVSFVNPEYTSEVSGIGTLRILEAIRFLNLKKTMERYVVCRASIEVETD